MFEGYVVGSGLWSWKVVETGEETRYGVGTTRGSGVGTDPYVGPGRVGGQSQSRGSSAVEGPGGQKDR